MPHSTTNIIQRVVHDWNVKRGYALAHLKAIEQYLTKLQFTANRASHLTRFLFALLCCVISHLPFPSIVSRENSSRIFWRFAIFSSPQKQSNRNYMRLIMQETQQVRRNRDKRGEGGKDVIVSENCFVYSGNVTRIKKKKRLRFVLFQLSSSFDFLFKEFHSSPFYVTCTIITSLVSVFTGFLLQASRTFERQRTKNAEGQRKEIKSFVEKFLFFFFFVSRIPIMDQKLTKIQKKKKKGRPSLRGIWKIKINFSLFSLSLSLCRSRFYTWSRLKVLITREIKKKKKKKMARNTRRDRFSGAKINWISGHPPYWTRKNAGFRRTVWKSQPGLSNACHRPSAVEFSSRLDRCLVGFQSVHAIHANVARENKPSCSA